MLNLEGNGYRAATIKIYKRAVTQMFLILFNVDLGQFLAIKKFVRSVSMKDPVEAKNEDTWNINILLRWVKSNLANKDQLIEYAFGLRWFYSLGFFH